MLEGCKYLTSAIATKKRENCAGDIATQHRINKYNVQPRKMEDPVSSLCSIKNSPFDVHSNKKRKTVTEILDGVI
jgi:hypothetical protein